MALTIGDLVGHIRADDSGMRRGLSDAELQMRGFQRDVEGRLRHLDGRFATVGEQIAAGLRTGSDEGRRFGFSLGRIAGMAGGLGGVAMSIGKVAGLLGAAVPLAVGLATTIANIAPAAGLAATGMVALQLATQAFKLGMVGVSDAVSAALDPEKAAEFEEAIAKLAPSAQAFAREVKSLAPEFKKLQQDVQERMFQGLDDVLKRMSTTTLPVLRTGLVDAGGALNLMAAGVGNAAIGLAKSGTLGKAISGATAGLTNLSRIPGQFVTGLTQVAAAAAPAFARLTKSAGSAFDRMSDRFSKAFESGAMERAIEQAITLIGDLAEVAGNVFQIIGSIFKAAEVSGGGFVGVLKEITGALADAFASPEVQAGLRAIFETMATLAKTAAPLLVSVLKILGPVFAELGPPAQVLVRALGDGLRPVIKALGPVLVAAAKAVGALVVAASPLLVLVGDLVAALLPALTPLLDACTEIFAALAPVVQQVATILRDTLTPVLAALTPIIEPLAKMLADQLVYWLGFLGDLLVELGPSLVKLGESLAQLLVACAPLIEAFAKLSAELLEKLAPHLPTLIGAIAALAALLADVLASNITNVLIPALTIVAQLLSGDFSGALDTAKRAAANMVTKVVETFKSMPGRAREALGSLGSALRERMTEAGMRMTAAIGDRVRAAVAKVRELPGKARDALGGLGLVLYAGGQSLVRGFIRGILSMIGQVASAASSVVSAAREYFPFSPAKKGPFSGKGWTLYSGQAISQALAAGMTSGQGAVAGAAFSLLAGAHPDMSLGMAGGGAAGRGGTTTVRIELSGPEEVKRLIRKIVDVDGGGSVQRAFGR